MGRAEQRKSKEGEYLALKYCIVRTIVHWFVIPILLGDDGFSVPPGPPFCIYPINSGLLLSFRSRPLALILKATLSFCILSWWE